MKEKGFWPAMMVIACFILGSLAATKVGHPKFNSIDSIEIKKDSLTIKIYLYAK